MSAKLLEGKIIAGSIKEALKKEVLSFKKKPKLIALQIGDNAASSVYIKSQMKRAEEVGIAYELKTLPKDSSLKECEDAIMGFNGDPAITGIILQLPLPKGIDHRRLLTIIDPVKDAEGMHPSNLGQVVLGEWSIAPCTASACMELIEASGVNLYGKEVVVVGHSEIVGKPLSLMLLSKFATTTVCHIATGERGVLPEHVKNAEILIVAVGKASLVKGDWIREGATVVDVGINRIDGKVVGDVEFEAASQRAAFITPVPGGVGPLTATMLMKNTVSAYKMQRF